jgi:hypothetical protein
MVSGIDSGLRTMTSFGVIQDYTVIWYEYFDNYIACITFVIFSEFGRLYSQG